MEDKTSLVMTAIVNVVSAVIVILGLRGLASPEELAAYEVLANAVIVLIATLAGAYTTTNYVRGRQSIEETKLVMRPKD